MQHAIIRMQPLNYRRQPCGPVKLLKDTIPRDGMPHRVGDVWDLNPNQEMPYFLRVWADDKCKDFEVEATPPQILRNTLKTVTCYMNLTVLPRPQ